MALGTVSVAWPNAVALGNASETAVWAWTDHSLWYATRSALRGPWPRVSGAPAPAAAHGALWMVGPGADELARWPVIAGAGLATTPSWRGRTGRPVEQLAASHDGRWAAAVTAEDLHLFDADGADSLTHRPRGLAGQPLVPARRLAAVDDRRSLLVDWANGGEWWELSLDPAAAPIYDGLVHDWRMGEALPLSGYRQPRRLPLGSPGVAAPRLLHSWAHRPWTVAWDAADVLVVHLDIRRPVLRWPVGALQAQPSAWAEAGWMWLAAGPHLCRVDTRRWRVVAEEVLPADVSALGSPAGRGDPRALIEGRWWVCQASGSWQPDESMPGHVGADGVTADANGRLACIGRSPMGADKGAAVLWCDGLRHAPWTRNLPEAAGDWRGLRIQPG